MIATPNAEEWTSDLSGVHKLYCCGMEVYWKAMQACCKLTARQWLWLDQITYKTHVSHETLHCIIYGADAAGIIGLGAAAACACLWTPIFGL